MKKSLSVIFTSLICINLMFNQIFADGETFTNFTDTDPDSLVDITSDYGSTELMFGIERRLVIDSAVSTELQQQFDVAGSHTIAFTGSYYDNTITGIQACNSSSYSYSGSNHTIDGYAIVQPAIYGSLNHSSQNMSLNIALDVEAYNGASESITTNSFENTTQACSLLGMNTGDGSIDGTVLLDAGYQKKTISYNDGSLNGHTATFYVPGTEDINLSTDDLEALVEDIYTNFITNLFLDYHFQYDFYLTGSPYIQHSIPEYGYLKSRVYLPLMFGYGDWLTSEDPDQWLSDNTLYYDQNKSDNAWADINTSFRKNLVDNIYSRNYSNFYWSGTDNPHWYFRSEQYRNISALSLNGGSNSNTPIYENGRYDTPAGGYTYYHWYSGLSEQLYRFTQNNIDNNFPSYTVNAQIPIGIGFNEIKYYKVQDSGRLSLFNQLGSFLQTQFNRLKSSIDNISGSGDSDLVIDIEDQYDVDYQTDIKNFISNLHDRDDDIDLTSPDFTLPDSSALQLISDIPSRTIGVFTSNKLGYMIFLPLIIAILGRILS